MRSLTSTKSLFGSCPYIFAKRINRWKVRKQFQDDKFLIIDDKDGLLAMCTLSSNLDTTVFEPDEVFIYGGKKDIPVKIPNTDNYVFLNRTIAGLEDRAKTDFLLNNIKIINKNFYEINNFEKYVYVAACRSLDRDCNKKFSMEDKIKKLKDAVLKEGYLYIEYYIALDENNYIKYPKNQYFRVGEIEKYFDTKEWTILSNEIEFLDNDINPLYKDRNSIVGYLDVRRKPTPLPKKEIKKTRIEYGTNEEVECRRNYIINGVVR